MDLVLQSLLPSADTIKFEEAVCSIIDREDPAEIEWNKLEDLVFECAGTSSAVFRGYPFLVHKILPKHPPVSVVSAVVSARPECLTLLDSYRPVVGGLRADFTPLGIACRAECSLEVIRFLIGKMVQLRSDHKYKKAFADFEKDRTGGLFATTEFDALMTTDKMRALVEEHPDGVLAMGDRVGKASLISQILFFKLSRERVGMMDGIVSAPQMLQNVLENNCSVRKVYLEKLEIVFGPETASGIPMAHAMMEVFTCTGRFKIAQDDARRSFVTEESITVHVQTGMSSQFTRDINSANVDRERDYFLLDEDAILWALNLSELHDIKDVDVHGRTLLHIALANPMNWKHAHSRTYGYEILQFLLKVHPEAVSAKDKRGRYPLQVAIENTSPCYEPILEATPPSVLESICPRTGLCLFQLPPKGPFLNEAQAALWTEISFRLLKKAPLLARGLAANPEPWLEGAIFKQIQIAKMRREQETGKIASLERRLEQLKLKGG